MKLVYFERDPNGMGRGSGYYYRRNGNYWSQHEAATQATRHKNTLGAGARARANLTPEEKRRLVLHEYKQGTLHSSSGEIVRNRQQAVAIALSEERRQRKRGYW